MSGKLVYFLLFTVMISSCASEQKKSTQIEDSELHSSAQKNSALSQNKDTHHAESLATSEEDPFEQETIVLYGNPQCGYCKTAMNFLNEKNIAYTFENVSENPKLLTKLQEDVGKKKFPYVYVGDKYIGGLVELQTHVNTNELGLSSLSAHKESHDDHP